MSHSAAKNKAKQKESVELSEDTTKTSAQQAGLMSYSENNICLVLSID
jgi:hypothetical protein